ncbi:MAG: hypothetical protein QXH07_03625 [Thermoplasmata archaeon]
MDTIILERMTDLMDELNNRKHGKVDMIVSTKNIVMKQNGIIHLQSQANNIDNDVEINSFEFMPTNWTHNQIAEKLKIPKQYYDRMRNDPDTQNLLAENVNMWLNKLDELVLVRAWNGEMIALLSNRYRAIDNYDIANIVVHTVYDKKPTIRLNKAYIDDKIMNFQLLDTETVYRPFDNIPNDVYYPGLNVRNSEVGYAAFVIEPFLYRSACKNGMIYGFSSIRQIHIGTRKDEGMYWSNKTAELEGLTILSKVNDAVQKVFSADFYQDVMEHFKLLKTEKIPIKIVDASLNILGFTQEEAKDIYKKIEGNSRFDFVQAITSKANDYIVNGSNNPERGYELQKIGGQLITDKELWKKIDAESEKI